MDSKTVFVAAAATVSVMVLAGPASRPPASVNVAPVAPPAAATRPAKLTDTLSAAVGRRLIARFLGTREGSRGAPTYTLSDVLIATVPDPVDSHMDWSWDLALEALRRAFESSGFIADRFWIPPLFDTTVAAKGEVMLRASPLRRTPGAILFRRTGSGRELKLLYLVGEVPTSGIHKEAFQAALDEREKLADLTTVLQGSWATTLRIIGPSFSGSSASMRELLVSLPSSIKRITLISGSATSSGNLATLTCGLDRVSFGATVHTDATMLQVLQDHVLTPMSLKHREVAILQEGSSEYGKSLMAEVGDLSGNDTTSFLTIPYPMSISSLRTAYQQFPDPQSGTPAIPGASKAPRLPLDLIDPTRPFQDLPMRSRLTPATLDLALDDIARTLRSRRVRLVGLFATDLRDKLFLAAELRKRVRDIQFFTFESSVLFLRSDWSNALHGMLVLSTYPLLLENQGWAARAPPARRLVFASDAAEGTYNAALLQLNQDGALLEYTSPSQQGNETWPPVWITAVGAGSFLPMRTVDANSPSYIVPTTGRSHVLAHAGVGECQMATTENGGAERKLGNGPHWKLRGQALGFGPLGIVVTILAGLACAWVFALMFLEPATTASAEPSSTEVEGASLAIHAELYAALLGVAVVAALLPLWLARASDPSSSPFRSWGTALAALLILALAAIAVRLVRVVLHFGSAWRPGWNYLRSKKWRSISLRVIWSLEPLGRLLVGLAGAWYAWLLLRYCQSVGALPADTGLSGLFAYRASRMSSLVSPTLTLVLGAVGFAVWCTWHMRRVALLQHGTLFEGACLRTEDDGSGDDDVFSQCHAAVQSSVRRVRSRLFLIMVARGGLVLFPLAAIGAAWLLTKFSPSIEAIVLPASIGGANAFDVLLRTLVVGSLLATIWAAFRLLAVWLALEEFLAHVNVTPLASGLERVPPHLGRMTEIHLASPRRHGVALSPLRLVAIRFWRHLGRIYSEAKSEDPQPLGVLEELETLRDNGLTTSVAQLMLAEAPDLDESSGTERLCSLSQVLRRLWSLEPGTADARAVLAAMSKDAGKIDDGPASGTSSKLRRAFNTPLRLWLRQAEDYMALQVLDYVDWTTKHLRLLALFLLVSLLLTTALVSTYPFFPQSLVRLIFFFLLLGTTGTMTYVLIQMNRNEVLSRITRTEPGRVTWNTGLVLNLVTFGALPLLALLSSELPGVREAAFSWAEPLFKALTKQ